MKILAVDLGRVRTGVAVSDLTGLIASPIGTITERDTEKLADMIAGMAKEHSVSEVVVGHPRNMDGTRGESARIAEDFAELLAKKTGLPVKLWDERLTTMSAIGILNETNVRGKRRKEVVDTVAATLILQDYLNSKREE
ncbi:MAG TPA: Holliday junction resolvase RuvX [Candidatus Avimonas sp.]|nr:Holliday junction resolvase RuvX [Clostridiales bacterium]HOB36442.1 Holliday junction resolvase RuvX [Candidatus Avimonas sp.]HQA15782.1 Holliday junction resolvase RuvX [Candidatus Avimonas sp.]HQD37910.1 Holliday junction resolvase RuvX [Candidatus Avimonas sp.]